MHLACRPQKIERAQPKPQVSVFFLHTDSATPCKSKVNAAYFGTVSHEISWLTHRGCHGCE